MTAEVFDRLLYTDCKPGTGRGAGGGFQIQAQSAGVDPAQAKLAVGWLLYDVQLPWLTQQRPVADFPPGLAHASGDGYGTAQGRYVGKVATGGRDGNYLADCLLTRDGTRYGPLRPAQLWRSALWRAEPWDSRDCPQLDAAELEPGPLTVDAVADWVRAAPARGPVLGRLLSVLEQPDGRRVIIVADDPQDAVSWIVAATLLLPSRAALDVSFKVFSAAPLDAKQRVVAAPAALFPRLVPGLGGQRLILDARANTSDEADTSERAAFFAERFASADNDPYDVVDAVELASLLGGGRAARLTAWALTCPDAPRPEPDVLFGWLSSAPPGLLAEHGSAVAAMVLAAAPPAPPLRWIDAAVTGKLLDLDPAAVRAQLLTAELAEIQGGLGSPPAAPLGPAPLDAAAYRDAESQLSSAILLASNQQADLMLALARRHGIEPEFGPLQRRLEDLADAWIARPGAYHTDQWALRAQILNCAHGRLRHLAGTSGIESVTGAVKRLNRYFADRADLTDPLDCHLQASLIAGGGREERPRLRQLLVMVAEMARTPARAREAALAADGLQRALLAWHAVDGDVAIAVLAELPDSLAVLPVISARAAEQLTTMSEKPSAALLDLLASLDKRGKAPKVGRLAGMLEDDRRVRAFLQRAGEEDVRVNQRFLTETLALIRQADGAVVRARLDAVLTACVQSRHPDLGAFVLAQLKAPLPKQLVEHWAATLGTRDLIGDGLWCAACLDYDEVSGRRQEQIKAAFREYARTLPPEQLQWWHDEVRRLLRPERRDEWDALFTREPPPRPRVNLWTNGNRDGGQ